MTTTTDYDETSLEDLIALAEARGIPGYHLWTGWLEDYYDPAKSALVDLLNWHAALSDTFTEIAAELGLEESPA